MLSPLTGLRRRVYLPFARIPQGRVVELPGRGSTYVTDTPGPAPDSPTIVLLHALGCTGLLTWYAAVEPLSRRFRVVTLDLRSHGRGIQGERFSLVDCADDVAALVDVLELEKVLVAGYSMGSIVAQRVWRQHGSRVSGLVLCATTDRFQLTLAERGFFTGMGATMLGLRALSRSRTAVHASRAAARALDVEPRDIEEWALAELRSTSPWAVAEAVAALGRHHSRPWLGGIDVPTAVVVNRRDRVIAPSRQLALARAIPGATIHDIEAGHASCVLESELFVPAVVEAAATVNARRR
jgi:pimeloyl-ACP methyl ester carboxylesterase